MRGRGDQIAPDMLAWRAETCQQHWIKKGSHFDLKSWVTGGTEIRPGFRVIGEYLSQIESQFFNWLLISSQFDSNILKLLRISGQILVPPVTQLFRSKWLHFFFHRVWWWFGADTETRDNGRQLLVTPNLFRCYFLLWIFLLLTSSYTMNSFRLKLLLLFFWIIDSIKNNVRFNIWAIEYSLVNRNILILHNFCKFEMLPNNFIYLVSIKSVFDETFSRRKQFVVFTELLLLWTRRHVNIIQKKKKRAQVVAESSDIFLSYNYCCRNPLEGAVYGKRKRPFPIT